jgi:hypothetical protein
MRLENKLGGTQHRLCGKAPCNRPWEPREDAAIDHRFDESERKPGTASAEAIHGIHLRFGNDLGDANRVEKLRDGLALFEWNSGVECDSRGAFLNACGRIRHRADDSRVGSKDGFIG